ncbi:MAG: hypothetical protein EOQ41_31765, partial [Mesorhizobium sp.]
MPDRLDCYRRGAGWSIEGGTAKLPISPLVGEMPGRAEGGVKDRQRSVHIESPSQPCPRDSSR